MADREIIPYGIDLNEKPDALELSVVPLQEMAPVPSNQSYFAQANHCLAIALPLMRLLLQDKPCQPKAPKIKVPKEINLLTPRANETLMGEKTNKFRDVTYTKYKSVTPCVTIDGVCATPEQVKIMPLKEMKKRAPPTT